MPDPNCLQPEQLKKAQVEVKAEGQDCWRFEVKGQEGLRYEARGLRLSGKIVRGLR